jgi:hypothetical protein
MREEMKLKVVKKGEPTTMPLNLAGYQWIVAKPDEDGIVITIGPTQGLGLFIKKSRLIEVLKQLEGGDE